MGLTATENFKARLRRFRLSVDPASSARSFAARIGVNPNTYLSWESRTRGSVPPEAVLAAALSRLPGADGLAVARWAREGQGDMPGGAGAGSARVEAPADDDLPLKLLDLAAALEPVAPQQAADARAILRDYLARRLALGARSSGAEAA